MSPILIAFVIALSIAQVSLPRRLGFLPLIVAACHLGNLEVLPEMTPARLLICLGLFRAVSGGFVKWSGAVKMDRWVLFFAIITLVSTIGHKSDQWVPSPFSARAGLVLNAVGTYLMGRAYLPDVSSFRRYIGVLPIVLLPLAALLVFEHKTRRNLYFTLGATSESAGVREDKVRAKGPFRHPILAGTAGATAMPLMFVLWYSGQRRRAIFGLSVCSAIVYASASSGPAAAAVVGIGIPLIWKLRSQIKAMVAGLILMAAFYSAVSGRGPWFLMASIDLVGGSTGWHRARLIDQGIRYLNEWWLFGSDYTRHWMASGVRWNPNHVDLTNYYLHMGVIGGLPLTICIMMFIFRGLRDMAARMKEIRPLAHLDERILWCAGASLVCHAVSFISISYFDQMYVFFYILLGAIYGLVATSGKTNPIGGEPDTSQEGLAELEPRYASGHS